MENIRDILLSLIVYRNVKLKVNLQNKKNGNYKTKYKYLTENRLTLLPDMKRVSIAMDFLSYEYVNRSR